MTEEKPAQQEDPRDRFRRLLDEAEKIEQETSEDDGQPRESQDEFDPPAPKPSADYPSTYLDLLGQEPEPGAPIHEELLSDTHPEDVIRSESHRSEELLGEDLNEGATVPREAVTTPPPPSLGTTPLNSPPALDTQGMPLPRRVDEIDMSATRVTPSAYEDEKPAQRPVTTPPIAPPPPPKKRVRRKFQADQLERGLGCVLRMSLLGAFIFVVLAVITASVGFYVYWQIANDLPDPSDLRDRVSQFETTRILDRNGNLLYEILDPTGGRRTYISLDDMSPYLVAATLATEDKEFYNHPGFDAMAIVRAFWQNLNSKETVSGASTITQQLTRTMFLSVEERAQRTYKRKLREAILAAEVTRRYTKNEILEIYLNENFYGNLAYGVEAAAHTYFGISAEELDLGQAAFVAGLPQLPSVYDVYTNRDVTLERQQTVLLLMFQTSQEQGCIAVGNSIEPVCVEASVAAEAARAFESYDFKPPIIEMRHPHWVNYVRSLLEAQYDPQTIYRSGFTVYTTLDPGLQDQAQEVVRNQVDSLSDRHVTNGALVVIRPSTGEIMAMVGSADFNNEDIDGQVNMAVSPRQPGSAIKPLTYVAAFEKGWTPSTLLWDVKTEFPPSGDPSDPRDPYVPVNYDNRYHGPMTVRTALANSINVSAVKTLDFVKIYDDPTTPAEDGLVSMAKRLGISSLTRDDYGLSLTLGGGDVSLLELSSAYAVFANGGRLIPPVAITRIDDHLGEIVFQYEQPVGEPVLQPEHAFLISSILSDNDTRAWMFGANSPLNLPFQVAAKTGTTNDFRDNWTIGYTPDVVVGTWVGNADYTPMQGTSGLTGAAPIWNSFMQTAVQQLTGGNPTSFRPPTGIVERVICSVSGTEPSQWCPSQRSEYFVAGQPPLPPGQDLWQKANIDTWTGLLASPACKDYTDNKIGLNISDPWAVKWIKETDQGRSWAKELGFDDPIFFTPQDACAETDSRPILEINAPNDG
ncbi:MAG: transglycosylase domain-containing protein, partial [Chloroflexi bacterium]|nr:transglycosylase domain-containing protein [Chloroflexota bacterium]